MTDTERLISVLKEKNLTVSTAESCTGGLISGEITSVPGASDVFGYGFVTYANDAKTRILGVKKGTLKKFGAVSPQTALEMAVGARLVSRSDYAVSATGVAGPGGGSDEKPVGLVYIAVASKNTAAVRENNFSGDRGEIRRAAVEEAIKLLLSEVTGK